MAKFEKVRGPFKLGHDDFHCWQRDTIRIGTASAQLLGTPVSGPFVFVLRIL
jgi:hypothetical protein